MTRRLVYLAVLGLVVVVMAALILPGLEVLVFVVYNSLLAGFYALDYFIAPKSDVLKITRQGATSQEDEKLYFKTANKILFRVRNSHHSPMQVTLKDEIADFHFKVLETDMEMSVAAGGESIFSYSVRPSKRGAFTFPSVNVKYTGPLGLCYKYFSVNEEKQFKVYPNLGDLSKYRLIITKHRLLMSGQKRIPKRGMGFEFESLREYVPGDDYKKINWTGTARAGKLIVNQYEAEKNQPVYILLDTGRAMSYSIRGYKKLDYSINAALILSDIVGQKGDNSGLMVFDTEVHTMIKPGKGAAHRNEMMEALYHIADSDMSSDYSGAFLHLLATQKRRSIVFIFTDFETGEEARELMEAVPILSKKHVPVVILCVNESLEKIAKGNAKDARGVFNEAMAESLIEERKALVRALNMRGAICLETYAENFAIDTVNQYLVLKDRFS